MALRAIGTTYPNPPVGAVIVNDGRILSRGWTQPKGVPHAEIHAINQIKNKKDIKNSELEPIYGLGRTRRKSLLNHFGSIQSIKTASSTDLEKVDRINKTMSEKIYKYFNN